ncbi:MAG: ABC transporter permease, partial [Pseudomonadales bacterium]|nr:ABC transporter permease [Pseudomonadales bacterium]
MLRDYLRSFWRMLRNNKFTSAINIGGLALGLAVFFALTFYVQREFSWDAQWEGAERIYTIMGQRESPNGNSPPAQIIVPYVLGTSLQNRNPEAFEVFARTLRTSGAIEVDGEQYSTHLLDYAEPTLLDLVQLETLEGSLQAVFENPRFIAISADAAAELFGNQSPLDHTLSINARQGGSADFTIKAVYRVPEPSVLNELELLALLDPGALPDPTKILDSWDMNASLLYVTNYFKLRPGFSASELESELRVFMDENNYMNPGIVRVRFTFMPLRDLHLLPSLFEPGDGDTAGLLHAFAAIGALVLLISGCNFVMLATLRSLDRVREVGIRKVMGAETGQLLRQYLLDVLLQTLMAALFACVLLEISLPWLQTKLGVPLALDLFSWRNLAQGVFVLLVFALLSGIYPAILMSRGKPVQLLRNSASSLVSTGNTLRRLLVGIQFAIVIALLLASAVLWLQIDYTRNRSRGYDMDNVMLVRTSGPEITQKMSTVLDEFNRVPGVAEAATGSASVSPGVIAIVTPVSATYTADDGQVVNGSMQSAGIGAGYFRVMAVPLLAGREFSTEIEGTVPEISAEQAAADVINIVLNLAATREMGFASPATALDRLIKVGSQQARIIGVVADTQFSSVLLPPQPQYYRYSQGSQLAIRLEPNADRTAVIADLQAIWTAIVGAVPFEPLSADMLEPNMLASEESKAQIITGSTILALIIALLGLYGLVEATVNKRTKEIGVRKA